MGFLLDFDATGKAIRISVQGVLTDQVLTDAFAAMNAACCRACYCIFDYTGVTEIALTSGVLKKIASEPSVIPMECLRVHIAPNDLMYGLARMFQAFAFDTRPNTRVVHTMDEALNLIGTKSFTFSPVIPNQAQLHSLKPQRCYCSGAIGTEK